MVQGNVSQIEWFAKMTTSAQWAMANKRVAHLGADWADFSRLPLAADRVH